MLSKQSMAELIKKPPEVSKSKYELTLSEFPLFLLSKKINQDAIKIIQYEDTIIGENGVEIKREWKVIPDGKLGFGTASAFSTLFELFQIWKDQNFNNQFVQFGSVYHLLKRLDLPTSADHYKQIIRDLNCLVGIRIEAKNAFWDNEMRAYVDMTFHLFDALYLYKEKPTGQAVLPFAVLKASDVLYGSIQKNALLTTNFDSKFFHNLTPIEQRLALYLSKVFRSQNVHKREILKLAQQIPIMAQQTKHIKEQIKKACTGLIKKGFDLLQSFEFQRGADRKTELVIFKKSGKLLLPFKGNNSKPKSQKEEYEIDILTQDILEICEDKKSTEFYKKVAGFVPKEMIYRALSEVKEIKNLGEIKKNKGAIFTSLIKKYAKERGIEL